jgi:hypothetical protein
MNERHPKRVMPGTDALLDWLQAAAVATLG